MDWRRVNRHLIIPQKSTELNFLWQSSVEETIDINKKWEFRIKQWFELPGDMWGYFRQYVVGLQ